MNRIVKVICPAGHAVYVPESQTEATCFKCQKAAHFKIVKEDPKPTTTKGESKL